MPKKMVRLAATTPETPVQERAREQIQIILTATDLRNAYRDGTPEERRTLYEKLPRMRVEFEAVDRDAAHAARQQKESR